MSRGHLRWSGQRQRGAPGSAAPALLRTRVDLIRSLRGPAKTLA